MAGAGPGGSGHAAPVSARQAEHKMAAGPAWRVWRPNTRLSAWPAVRRQAWHDGGWLAGCLWGSLTCWCAGYSALLSWCSAGTGRRTLSCWCSGMRTRCCAGPPAGCGTSPPTGPGSLRWPSSSRGGSGPRSSRWHPRRCWPGTADWPRGSTTRAPCAVPKLAHGRW